MSIGKTMVPIAKPVTNMSSHVLGIGPISVLIEDDCFNTISWISSSKTYAHLRDKENQTFFFLSHFWGIFLHGCVQIQPGLVGWKQCRLIVTVCLHISRPTRFQLNPFKNGSSIFGPTRPHGPQQKQGKRKGYWAVTIASPKDTAAILWGQ